MVQGVTARNWTLLGRDGRIKSYGCNGCRLGCSTKSTAHPQRCIKEMAEKPVLETEEACFRQTPNG